MRIERIRLKNYRNYSLSSAEFSPGINIVTGLNAQGKTNLLEAVCALSLGKSFRPAKEKELIKKGEESAEITAKVFFDGDLHDFALRFFSSRPRHAEIDGVKAKTSAAFAGKFRTVIFTPDDLGLVKEGAAVRRRFLDSALIQLRPRYTAALSQYNRLLADKLRILKSEEPSMLSALDAFTERMTPPAAAILRYRKRYIAALNEQAAKIHAEAGGGEKLELRYKTVSTVPDDCEDEREIAEMLYSHALSHRAAEIASQSCLSGVHKDELEIFINGAPARSFASQGQARTAALSLKLAEREISRRDCNQSPVLILDDVLSELDEKRRDFVLNRISGGQVIMSCCEQPADALPEARRIFVHEGAVKE